MNKKGQTLALGIVIAIFLFIIGMMNIDIVKNEVANARNSTNLDCTNASGISDGTKLTCLSVDIVVPYFFLLVLSITGGVIITRFLK